MTSHLHGSRTNVRITVLVLAWTVLACTLVGTRTVSAQTYVSAEPIPKCRDCGRNESRQDSRHWLSKPGAVVPAPPERLPHRRERDHALSNNTAISTVNPGNSRYLVAAGGFQGVTDPSFVLTTQDLGPLGVSAADVFVLNNALGYVLNQSGTAQFGRLQQAEPLRVCSRLCGRDAWRISDWRTGQAVLRLPGYDRSGALERHERRLHAD